ncbi:MAG TPA: PLP-dependent aminotransferase family protein [candidate division Zixibacteria bacterium]|nr:PLP-dependent aminotransferase family protein [candidate division Zixibacteria bacterium]
MSALQPSAVREILKISNRPGVISFAGGLPAPELFPLDEIAESARRVIQKYQGDAVQYSLTLGLTPLRQLLAERFTDKNEPTKLENIIITSGSQQGVEMVTRVFIEPGDTILTEYPTYVGALQIFQYQKARVVCADMDEEGLIVEQVEEKIIKHKPKFIYVVSTFQNPTGITMTESRRLALLEVAEKYGVPIVDDDPYGDLRFKGEHVPTLKELGGDSVISLGTVSKILAPGLRIGWANARKDLITILEKLKQADDLHAGTLNQYIFLDFIQRGLLEPHIKKIRENYGAKRETMLAEMERHFPPGVTWTKPEGGLFLWVTMPKHINAQDVFDKAIAKDVAFVIGQPFYPDGKTLNTFRINYATASKSDILTGIKTLASILKEMV